ncbi:hypothetical protein [Streptomyces sp. IB2014 016-6]|uniref:hypothetical protein n=1 Tax=Streptomyces sp. IB2014 016-6 TaxID=2517818 RepID=UPI0011C7937F|nr:hypothetical protein [Streptomyces sp. IB2014 016-6]TXL88625.1 hypothetical protein EW053_17985 [Streptomyces sp. IB2014 016-6]
MAFDTDGVQFGGELVEERYVGLNLMRFGATAQAVGGLAVWPAALGDDGARGDLGNRADTPRFAGVRRCGPAVPTTSWRSRRPRNPVPLSGLAGSV